MKTSGATKLAGIIGYPIAHSISPQMHNAALEHLGLNWKYVPFEVKPEGLKNAVEGFRAEGLIGFNVTIPHKEAILPLLDEVEKLPKKIGAVNTVKNENGRLVGYNTDGPGFIESLKLDAKIDPKGKKIVLLGAGGAAKACAATLAEVGASSITITDIAEKKAQYLVDYLSSLYESEIKFARFGGEHLAQALSSADIIVNATPIGMHPNEDESPIGEDTELRAQSTVFDLVYNPPETKLMRMAEAKGCKVVNGLGMLVRQGALSLTLWTGQPAPVDVMWKAAKEALGLK